jgi:glycosyltransferase involved in cell wall biosynthesis
MSRKDLVDLYKAADLFVNVSHIEYSPLVLFEAAAAGTPFIASSAGNSEEIACWIRGGVVLPRVNNHSAKVSIDSVAREMENLLIDKEKLIAIGIAARVDVWSKGFIWSEIVKRYRQILIAR